MGTPSTFAARGRLLAPLLVALAALAVRGAFQYHLEAYPRLELIRNALDDQVLYDSWAKHILAGQPMDWEHSGHEFAYWAPRRPGVFPQDPLYSYALAGFYGLFGFEYGGARALQALLGVGTAVLVWGLARGMVNPPAALAAGLLAALYQPLVFYEATLLREPLATFLAAGGLVLAQHAGRAATRRQALLHSLGGGLALGLAVLVRSHLALPAAAVVAWLLLSTRNRLGLQPSLALAGIMALTVAPAVAVNVVRSKGPAFVSSAAPYNLFIGNVHDGGGAFSPLYAEVKAQGPPESVDLLGALADDVAAHPLAVLRLQVEKVARLLGTQDSPDNVSLAMGRALDPRLRWALVTDALLVPLGLLGLALSAFRWREHGLLHAFFVAYVASVVPFIVVSRLRLPLLPVLAAGAAVVVDRAWALARGRRGRALAGLLALATVSLGALWPRPQALRHTDYQMAAAAYETLGQQREEAGDDQGARRAYGRAVALNPDHQGAADAAARLDARRGASPIDGTAAALCQRARAAAGEARYAEALELLAEAQRLAPEWSLPYQYRANVMALSGDRRRAVADLEQAVARAPEDARLRALLKALRREAGLER